MVMANARTDIEAAFRKLDIRAESERRLPGLVATFSALVGKVDVKTPAKFLPSGHAQAKRELRAIAKHAAALHTALGSAHEPTIFALADNGFLHHEIKADLLIRLARAASTAEPRTTSAPVKGRPPNAGAAAIATLALGAYRDLTGKIPTLPTDPQTGLRYGPFLNLVTDLFSILKVTANPEAAARKVCGEFKEKNIKKA